MVEAMFRELHDAGTVRHEIVRIRVTHDAVRGTPVAAPFTPERTKSLRQPRSQDRELLIHPADWRDLLVDPVASRGDLPNGPVTSIYGLPVVNESRLPTA